MDAIAFTCNGVPATIWQAVDAEMTITRLFQEAKSTHEIPANAHLTFEAIGGWHMATYRNGDTSVDPWAIACLNPVEIKAMYKHELGHYHNQPAYDARELAWDIQSGLIVAFAVVGLYKAARFALRRYWPYEFSKLRVPVFSSLVALHTIFGAIAADYSYNDELQAESYAVRTMGSKEPVLQMAKRIATTQMNMPENVIEWRINNLMMFGLIGARHWHPTQQEFMAYVRSLRPDNVNNAMPKQPEFSKN